MALPSNKDLKLFALGLNQECFCGGFFFLIIIIWVGLVLLLFFSLFRYTKKVQKKEGQSKILSKCFLISCYDRFFFCKSHNKS